MSLYHLLSIIILLSAIFGYVNFRFIKWPQTIGIMVLSLLTSILLAVLGPYFPILKDVGIRLSGVDFNTILMEVMLAFLLFAGGMHINAASLRQHRVAIMTLAVFGTLLSTFLVGGLSWLVFSWLGLEVPFLPCLLFGALISPTDPIAVLGILKEAKIPHALELKISGESLFNDGVAVVLFMTIAGIVASGTGSFAAGDVALLFAREAGGGILYGLLLGYLGYLALKSIDNYQVEVLITLAVVMAGYYFAHLIHVSGPLAMVVAGIMTGNRGRELAMSDVTRDYLTKFWELVDEILNSVLFLFIGLEMLVVKINGLLLLTGLILILVVLAARWMSVALPVTLLRRIVPFEKHAVKMLTWGGLRGGISVALALSLPPSGYRDLLVTVTYIIVIFSILVQGLTIGKLARKLTD